MTLSLISSIIISLSFIGLNRFVYSQTCSDVWSNGLDRSLNPRTKLVVQCDNELTIEYYNAFDDATTTLVNGHTPWSTAKKVIIENMCSCDKLTVKCKNSGGVGGLLGTVWFDSDQNTAPNWELALSTQQTGCSNVNDMFRFDSNGCVNPSGVTVNKQNTWTSLNLCGPKFQADRGQGPWGTSVSSEIYTNADWIWPNFISTHTTEDETCTWTIGTSLYQNTKINKSPLCVSKSQQNVIINNAA